MTNEHSSKQVNASDTYEVKHEYLGFTITARIDSRRSTFQVSDANGDALTNKDSQADAVAYIDNKLEREGKKAEKARPKLDLKVVVPSHRWKNTGFDSTLTSVHGGSGQVIIDGEQRHDSFYPDTPAVRKLVKELVKVEDAEGQLLESLNKYRINGRRSGYGARGMDVHETQAALVDEYKAKAGLK